MGGDAWLNCSRGHTILHDAMAYARPSIVAALIDANADCHAISTQGWTPDRWASRFNRVDNLELLFNRFPDWRMDHCQGVAGQTMLTYACTFPRAYDCIVFLIERRANIEEREPSGSSALIKAVGVTSTQTAIPGYLLDNL